MPLLTCLSLFVRVRRTHIALLAISGFGAIGLLLRGLMVELPGGGGFAVPWTMLLSLLMACVVSVFVRSPVGEIEAGAVQPMAMLRAAHELALLLLGTIFIVVASQGVTEPFGTLGAVRDLYGLAGAGLICAFFVGGRLSWILPISLTLITATAGVSAGEPRWWAWLLLSEEDTFSWGLALLLLLLGSSLVSLKGTNEPVDEAD